MDKNTFGSRLRSIRLKLGYNSQSEFAKVCGIMPPTVSHYENDKRMPSIETLIRISKLANVSIDYLVGNNLKSEDDDNLSGAMLGFFNKLDKKNKLIIIKLIQSLNKK